LLAFQTAKEWPAKGLFGVINNKLVVTSVRPDTENSIIVRLFNPDASAQETSFNFGSIEVVSVTNVQTDRSIKNHIKLLPMAVAEVRIVY
jgi:alpha-mannosidase